MKIRLTLLLFFIIFGLQAQEGFIVRDTKTKVVIPFQLISNLIFVDVIVNGVELTFLLDTGVAETVLFTLDENQSVIFKDIEKIQLQGMGSQAPIDALIAKTNSMKIGDFSDDNHTILIVLNQEVNFSPNVGIPVNGILGFDFFRNYPTEIDYLRKRIVIRKESLRLNRKLKKFESFPIEIIKDKPYLDVLVKTGNSQTIAKVLVDNGNSDALWLFADRNASIELPKITIADFLGRGFSGNIYGEKGRVESVKIGKFDLKNIITSFPDSISTHNINSTTDRLGSIGGEVLRRFDQIFDYKNRTLYLKPNKNYTQEFIYDKSGLEIQHDGVEWVQDRIEVRSQYKGEVYDGYGERMTNSFAYKFELKPVYKVFNVRSGSAADLAGIMIDDQIISINGKNAFRLKLDQLNKLLRGEDDKLITIEVMRASRIVSISFRLKTML